MRSAGAIELPNHALTGCPGLALLGQGSLCHFVRLAAVSRGCSWGRASECIFVDKTGDVKFKGYFGVRLAAAPRSSRPRLAALSAGHFDVRPRQ